MRACTDAVRRIAAREIDAREEVARQDLATAMADIFTPRAKRQRLWIETEVVYRGVRVRIAAPELDASDLGVLLALHAIAAGDVGDVARCAARGALIPADRRDENACGDLDSVRVNTSISEIARMIGRDARDGRAARAIRASLTRLMGVVITATNGDEWAITHLIDGAAARGGGVAVSLNYRATKAVTGTGQWAAVEMSRWRAASGDVERVLLHRIAALTTGRLVTVHLDTLASKCWTTKPKNDLARRQRRALIRKAIESGNAIPTGIAVSIDVAGLVTFSRRGVAENTQNGRVVNGR